MPPPNDNATSSPSPSNMHYNHQMEIPERDNSGIQHRKSSATRVHYYENQQDRDDMQ